jgi:hypothetical protein
MTQFYISTKATLNKDGLYDPTAVIVKQGLNNTQTWIATNQSKKTPTDAEEYANMLVSDCIEMLNEAGNISIT